MRRVFRLALAAAAVGGVAFAQVQARPLPAPIPPPGGGGIGIPGPVAVYTGPTAFQKTVNAHLVVTGTVSVAKETVEAPLWQGSPTKATFRVAIIKVTDTLLGEKAATVKVLLGAADPTYINDPFPGQPPQPYVAQVPNQIQLIDGQEGTFFLTKHQTVADAYTHAPGSPPLNPLDTKYKAELEEVKAVGAVHADPTKALKAEKAGDRMKAAFVLVTKYRRPPAFDGKAYEQKALAADEAKLIFKALQDADWELWDKPQQPGEIRDYTLNPTNLLSQLQIYTGAPGKGNFPQVRPQPGQGYYTAYKAAFTTWMEGDGKDFEIKRYLAPGEKKDEPKK